MSSNTASWEQAAFRFDQLKSDLETLRRSLEESGVEEKVEMLQPNLVETMQKTTRCFCEVIDHIQRLEAFEPPKKGIRTRAESHRLRQLKAITESAERLASVRHLIGSHAPTQRERGIEHLKKDIQETIVALAELDRSPTIQRLGAKLRAKLERTLETQKMRLQRLTADRRLEGYPLAQAIRAGVVGTSASLPKRTPGGITQLR